MTYLPILPEQEAHTRSNTFPYIDPLGRYRVKTLFYEEAFKRGRLIDHTLYRPVWTLKERDITLRPESKFFLEWDGTGRNPNLLLSIRQLYLSHSDPTEYQFAVDVVGSWDHWKMLRGRTFLKPLVEEWREQLKLKIESEAFQAARKVAATGDGVLALQASKWLHSAVQPKSGKGRPSKEQIALEAKRLASEQRDEKEDSSRVGMTMPIEELSDAEQQILEDL